MTGAGSWHVASDEFAPRLMAWQKAHGRHGLPWQIHRQAYSVWISEVMLQQTQVSTVMAYFPRFMARFPTVSDLALAQADEVMSLWTGLGYYSRARNLHACAKVVHEQMGGQFPPTARQLNELPGIGPSTAAAIAAFCFGERVSIFDGNVKRVLARWLGFEADLGLASGSSSLGQAAQALLPYDPGLAQMQAYTQGLMDLGATLCTPKNPQCPKCPMLTTCSAALSGRQLQLPLHTKKLKRSAQSWHLLFVMRLSVNDNRQWEVWLEKRPPTGIWALLYTPPIFESQAHLLAALPVALGTSLVHEDGFKHVLTHKDLYLHPVLLREAAWQPPGAGRWLALNALGTVGLPAPVLNWLSLRANEQGA